MDQHLFAAPLCLLCLAAVLAVSLPAALLLIAVLSGVLLLTMLCAVLATPAGTGWRLAFCLLLDAALGTGIWLLLAHNPLWQTWAGPLPLFMAAVLLCTPAAIQLVESTQETPFLPALLRTAGVLLLTGAARELLASGTLFRIKVFPAGLSGSFGLGAAGVLLAGLLLLLCGIKGRHFYRVPLRRGGSTALTAAVRTAISGVVPVLLLMLRPDLPAWLLFPLVAGCSGLISALGLLLCKNERVRAALADGVTAAAGIAVMAAALYAGSEWATLLSPLWAGAAVGLSVWLWTGAYSRIDSQRMPDWARGGPAAVVTAGLCLLAFSVLQ